MVALYYMIADPDGKNLRFMDLNGECITLGPSHTISVWQCIFRLLLVRLLASSHSQAIT
jgi:hypothetical protein